MTKKDLVDTLADCVEITAPKTQIALILDKILEIIPRAAEVEPVRFRGFGVFTVKTRAASVRRNPKTGDKVDVPERQALTFKASKA